MFIKQPNGRYRKASRNEVMELAAEYHQKRHSLVGAAIRSPSDTTDYLKGALAGLESERFCAIFLDNRHRVLAFEVLFKGTIDGTSVYPREVVKRALEHNAAAMILSHNHPSGVAEPSQADERITKRLKVALELIDCRVLDHVIIAGDTTTSLASRGML